MPPFLRFLKQELRRILVDAISGKVNRRQPNPNPELEQRSSRKSEGRPHNPQMPGSRTNRIHFSLTASLIILSNRIASPAD